MVANRLKETQLFAKVDDQKSEKKSLEISDYLKIHWQGNRKFLMHSRHLQCILDSCEELCI